MNFWFIMLYTIVYYQIVFILLSQLKNNIFFYLSTPIFILSLTTLLIFQKSKDTLGFSDFYIVLWSMIFLWAIRSIYYFCLYFFFINKDRYLKIELITDKTIKGVLIFYWKMIIPKIISTLLLSYMIFHTFQSYITSFIFISWVGIFVFFFGLGIKSISDLQLYSFKKDNPNKFYMRGIRKYLLHPKLLGELLSWWGISLFILANHFSLYILVSPISISLLIIYYYVPLKNKQLEKYTLFMEHRENKMPLIPS